MKSRMMQFGSAFVVALITAGAWSQNAPAAPPAKPVTPPAAEQEKPKIEYVQLTIGGAVKGDIVLELNREKAPTSVDNFLSYVDKKFYDGTIFHRVMPGFMIQGGGHTADMKQKQTGASIKNEWRNGLKNVRGALAMARLGGNPDSATSQFFINVVDNAKLDQPQGDGAAYAVFGKVAAGMSVVDAIKVVPTATKRVEDSRSPTGYVDHGNVPTQTVTIEKAARISADEAKKKIEAESKPATPTTPAPSQPASSN
jgi:peptidyl-prolyl cis-trans isomerase A (cyclophilin A)